jgi:L-seryl-tRNA(Ser) seleniumtransferase
MSQGGNALQNLPSVDRLLQTEIAVQLLRQHPRALVVGELRLALQHARAALRADTTMPVPSDEQLAEWAAEQIAAHAAPTLRPVINATGVVLHTNLGRALLAAPAVEAVQRAAEQPCNLEYDIAAGERGERDAHVEGLLCMLTGAEAALVVNNNAAAVLLALNTLAERREVIVSRGELIEIGGSFRIPEILAKSGAVLREVGTTNRTHASDYEHAVCPQTGLLLKVHPSNYRIDGFTADVALDALVAIAHRHGLPVVEDLGSGALIDLTEYGLPREPVVAERVGMGADAVTFSGDKLLGGPQAGLIVGRSEAIERMRRNPLKRALRCDKLTLAALEATLRLYRTAPDLAAALPTLRTLTRPLAELDALGHAALLLLRAALGPEYRVELVESQAEIGSGAQPTETLPSRAIAVTHREIGPQHIAARFRAADPPIIGRIHEQRFLLDLRCIARPEDLVPSSPNPQPPTPSP